MNDNFLTVKQVAAELKHTEETIRKWCREGRIETFRVTPQGHYRIYPDYRQRYAKKHGLPEVEVEDGK